MTQETKNGGGNSPVDDGNIRGSRKFETRDAHMEYEELADSRERTEDRMLSDEEFLARLNESDGHNALPNPPKVEGWHFKWASTANPYDNVQGDLKMGYKPVKINELPGYYLDSLKTGAYEGCIGCNEMVLMKIEERRYQMLMKLNHHDKPMALEANIMANAKEKLQSGGKNLLTDVDEGMANLGKAPARPRFE